MSYNHHDIDLKWQQKWAKAKAFQVEIDPSKPKYYALDMFPYPSGSGLHVGHLASYTPTDIVARYKRACGYNVLHPMGYDAFGLPAEQYAIQTGVHPEVTTQKAIINFRRVLQSFGYSFDWNREISTCDPSYYKWTQFIFSKLFEKGLAYQTEAPVNWCPELKTVLANDEVIDGKSERGGHPVIRKPMKQWMLKITDYAERLLQDLDLVDWPERTKEAQRHWIGKSEGAQLHFKLKGHSDDTVEVYTTRPDTLFGVSFMVLAPEHPLIEKITPKESLQPVRNYIQQTTAKSEIDRKASTHKSGVFTGAYALHPFTNQMLPIWISDYVLMDYGTGAIMAVPGHDARDFEFATTFDLPILRVLEGGELPFEGDGTLVNSEFLNGLEKSVAIAKAIEKLEALGVGKKKIQYKLRDWLFSRQRYWGEPFPLLHTSNGETKIIPPNELPVVLPEVADYEPTETGEAPLARSKEWMQYKGEAGSGLRETDTMPGSAGSSWYFLRYIDPHNTQQPFSEEAQKYWMPVDFYLGGAEHTVGHLLYSRFWHKVLFDIGLVSTPEPFKKLVHQGLVLGPDGEKMSKSRGNVVNPDEVRDQFGADAARCYISFMGPLDKDKPWATNGIDGVRRFLDRVWRLVCDDQGQVHAKDQELPLSLEKLMHKTIKKVTDDIEALSFNTALSAMMIFTNELYKAELKPTVALKTLAQLMMPLAPHIAEEIWEKLGGDGFASLAPWPQYKQELVIDNTVVMAVQVLGKTRGTIEISLEASQEDALQAATALSTVQTALAGQPITKVIYKPGKILNIITK